MSRRNPITQAVVKQVGDGIAAELRTMIADARKLQDEGPDGYARACGLLIGRLELIAERFERAAGVERPRCAGCGEFLSAVRVEMRVTKCANCDGRSDHRRRIRA